MSVVNKDIDILCRLAMLIIAEMSKTAWIVDYKSNTISYYGKRPAISWICGKGIGW